jgi:hypothetical protein
MDSFNVLLQDSVIKSFLRRFPAHEWGEVVRKTLKYGIYSMNTIESLCATESPEKKIKFIELENEDNLINQNQSKFQDTTPSSIKENKELRNSTQALKHKSTSLKTRKKLLKNTPRSKKSYFEFYQEKKETRNSSSKHSKSKIDHIKISKPSLKIPSCVEEGFKNDEKTEFSELEKSYTKSFNSLNHKIFDSYLSPKVSNVPPSYRNFSLVSAKDSSKRMPGCKAQRSALQPKRKSENKLNSFGYATSSSEDQSQ